MPLILFGLFFVVPLVEIYFLIKVGGIIGAWPTVAAVVATAVLGAWLVRLQGLGLWREVNRTLARGELPAEAMLEGMVVLVAGALLLTPGFVTDALGFACLVPPLRRAAIRLVLRRSLLRVMGAPPASGPAPGPPGRRGRTLEGSARRVDDRGP